SMALSISASRNFFGVTLVFAPAIPVSVPQTPAARGPALPIAVAARYFQDRTPPGVSANRRAPRRRARQCARAKPRFLQSTEFVLVPHGLQKNFLGNIFGIVVIAQYAV